MDDFKKPVKKLRLEPSDNFDTPKVNADEHDFSQNIPPMRSNFDIPTVSLDDLPEHIKPKESKMKNFFSWIGNNKKISIPVITLCLIALIGAGYLFIFKKDQPQTATTKAVVVKKQEEKKITSPLTGRVLASAELAKRPVTSLMIENSPDARPQSGLLEADMVVEAIAEGGVTRFMAVYQESQPQYIGPIRSARPYYLDYALPLESSYGHVGGSPQALQDIKTLGIRDLDQFFNADTYWRITDRFAPHNVYTSFEKLDKTNQAKGFTSSKFTGFERKADVPQTPTAKTIDLAISGPLYSPRFEYDQATNSYNRFQDSSPHTDQKSSKQITPKVVVALVVNSGNDPDGYHSAYNTSGTGAVYVFQDGVVTEGTWSKTDRKSPLVLTDKNGLPIKLNSGQTWISLVGTSSDITYKP
jgi:hypothetical protein